MGKAIMVQGTASHVGKSILTAALCRILRQEGFSVAPFKSQNMALNSYVTPDGLEIGRAQALQAEACGIEPEAAMNPILLKPTGEMSAQVVVMGKPLANMTAREYRENYLDNAIPIVKQALDELLGRYDVVVMEGAGSPVELNLKGRDIVNMAAAKLAQAPVVLIGDIDRGGIFASLYGTVNLLPPDERDLVVGLIVNKFRGDLSLFADGVKLLDDLTHKPVLGVIPYLFNLDVDEEDSVSLDNWHHTSPADVNIAVIKLPRISNFTDFAPLACEAGVRLFYTTSCDDILAADVVIIPGTKNTVADLAFLRETGLAEVLLSAAQQGRKIIGICGGYQLLGYDILDPYSVETNAKAAIGLGLLPITTTFHPTKTTVRCQAISKLAFYSGSIVGYEIHMGNSVVTGASAFEIDDNTHLDGCVNEAGTIWGTYIHGVFDNDDFRWSLINSVREAKGLHPLHEGVRYHDYREAELDRLAAHVRKYLDIDKILQITGLR
ncbi:MAG: adenosylcobyric acid synthase [Bacillota bacterium]|nr:MAG: adenosylcobyric acid synthase [Bacillota bacterium]